MQFIDWFIVAFCFSCYLLIGFFVSKNSTENTEEYFLSGRKLSWWLIGISLVATTFSADTPNLVTNMVRTKGIAANWSWWAFLLTGMMTVFIYAKLWRRSNVFTDLEFYDFRYGGKAGSFLRGFRSIYLGIIFNVMIMASVSLAAIKIGGVILGITPIQTLMIASVIVLFYSTIGGAKSVIITDFVQFIIAMVGSISAAVYFMYDDRIGGIAGLISNANVASKLEFFPATDNLELFIGILIIPILLQWWSVWYPGSEPGGGGYVAQRILSAKSEQEAVFSTLLFNVTHYAVRSWPWILVALASLIVYPDLNSLRTAFPDIPNSFIQDDIAYPAMVKLLPSGLLGILVTSLIAAYMSTISTHLNWGASYLTFDFYKEFINPTCEEKKLVRVGQIATVFLMLVHGILALFLESALQSFQILLSIGAGTGLIFILRWFWWRVNAYSEISGMIISFVVSVYFNIIHKAIGFQPISDNMSLVLSIAITTAVWLIVTFLTPPTDEKKLIEFYLRVRPQGPGWNKIKQKIDASLIPQEASQLGTEILCMILGVIAIYFLLFGVGELILDSKGIGIGLLGSAVILGAILFKQIKKLKFH